MNLISLKLSHKKSIKLFLTDLRIQQFARKLQGRNRDKDFDNSKDEIFMKAIDTPKALKSEGKNLENESLRGTKQTKNLVNKKMSIQEQIAVQKNKKGQKVYYIDNEEQVNWFMRKYVDPIIQSKDYKEYQKEKERLIEQGVIPKDPEKQQEYYKKQAEMEEKKLLEEMELKKARGESIVNEGESIIIPPEEVGKLSENEILRILKAHMSKEQMKEIDEEENEIQEEERLIEELEKQSSEEVTLDKEIIEEKEDKGKPKVDATIEQKQEEQQESLVDIIRNLKQQSQSIKTDNDNHDEGNNKELSKSKEKGKKLSRKDTEKLQLTENKEILLSKKGNENQQTNEVDTLQDSQSNPQEKKKFPKFKITSEAEIPIEQEPKQITIQKAEPPQIPENKTKQSTIVNLQTNEASSITQREKLLNQFATGDQKLNEHIFGNIPLKPIDFTSPEVYKMFKTKKPSGKKDVYHHQLERLNILVSFYNESDFKQIKMHQLNSDQIVTFLGNPNFYDGLAPKEKVIEAIHFLHKQRQIKLLNKMPEIDKVVKLIALDHNTLRSLQPQTYVTSFVYSIMKMGIEDPSVWSSLASYIAENHKQFDLRNITNITYSLQRISQKKPVILNFDDLFTSLELPIIQKLDKGLGDPQSISNAIMSYAKSQNGSQQFFQAMERHILEFQDKFNPQELGNIIYSYYKNPECNKELIKDLEETVIKSLDSAKPIDLVNMLMAYTETQLLNDKLVKLFEKQFISKWEEMNAEDISKYYYCFTKAGFKGDGRLYKHLQKDASKLIDTFEGNHLSLMFYKFDEEDKTRLNTGVRGRLMDRALELIKNEKIKGYDANQIYLHTKNLKPNREGKTKHDFHVACKRYLEKIKYFV